MIANEKRAGWADPFAMVLISGNQFMKAGNQA